MKFLLRLCGLLFLFALLPAAKAQFSAPKVARIDIKHVGPPAVSDELVRANIRVKVGDPYLPLAVDDDVRNLYATGQFYNIRVGADKTNDEMILTYVLQGKPRLMEIKFQGNTKFNDSKLLKKMSSKVGEPLDERKLFTDSQEIQKMYQKAGYPGTQVKYIPSIDENTGRGTVIIDIKESRKIKIIRIDFVGANAFTEKQLRKVLKTKKHWMFSWLTGRGVFKDEQFEDDKELLADFYRSKGYIDFELKESEIQFEHPTPNTMVIRIPIEEGRQYKVGSIKFTGNKLFTAEEITAGLHALQPSGGLVKKVKLGPHGLKMDVGDVFTPKGYADNIKQLEDFYGSKGYLDAAHTLEVVRIPNTESGTMDLEFKIDEGQKSFIEKIDIRGNSKTKDRVIRRELTVAPGDVFDMVRVNQSKEIIEGLQFFEKVDARPEPTEVPSQKDLVIGVDEANTGNLTVGAGLSSDSGLVGFAEITQGNFDLFHPPTFTGGGQKFRLRVQLGTERQDYEMSFVEPWFLGRRLSLAVDLYHRDLNFQSLENLYDERRTGGHVGLLKELPRPLFLPPGRLVGGVGYRLEDVGIDFHGSVPKDGSGVPGFPTPIIPETLLAESGDTLVSKLDASLVYDTRGPGLLPEKGQQTELSAELAGPFGGEKDYYSLEIRTHWYIKGFFPGHVLEVLGSTAVADAYGSTADVPFYDRFYLGGINSLRGFKYRSVSPRDPANPEDGSQSKEPVGGDTRWFGSVEYSLPIIDRLRFAVFYDIGDVRLQPYRYDFSKFSDNWGFGLRLNLPIGGRQGMPLRLDYGIPIHYDKQFNNGSGQFQFSAGFDRPF